VTNEPANDPIMSVAGGELTAWIRSSRRCVSTPRAPRPIAGTIQAAAATSGRRPERVTGIEPA
jgi:hypothetical protein